MEIPEHGRNNKIWISQCTADDDKIDEVKETEDDGTNSEKENLN